MGHVTHTNIMNRSWHTHIRVSMSNVTHSSEDGVRASEIGLGSREAFLEEGLDKGSLLHWLLLKFKN